jgi:type I restriction enzyme M protein
MIADRLVDDARGVWGEPGPNDGNAAWIQHCLYHLADGGRAVLVLPNGALFESGRAGRIRQRIVKAGLLDALISLPPGLFPWTALPCSILVFVKGRRDIAGKPAPTLMLDLSDVAHGQSNRNAALADDLIADVAGMYRSWTRGSAPTGWNVAVATFEELAANEFIIDPARYLSLPDSPDLGQAEERREALIHQLSALTNASREADEQLSSILEGRK